jgi:hypothetical protein
MCFSSARQKMTAPGSFFSVGLSLPFIWLSDESGFFFAASVGFISHCVS